MHNLEEAKPRPGQQQQQQQQGQGGSTNGEEDDLRILRDALIEATSFPFGTRNII